MTQTTGDYEGENRTEFLNPFNKRNRFIMKLDQIANGPDNNGVATNNREIDNHEEDNLPTTLPSRKRPLNKRPDEPDDLKGQSANDRAAAEAVKNENGLYVCPLCEQVLRTSHDFTVHIRQHNPNDHSHTCRLCGKTLSSASSLDRHMLVHSGERPFKCKLCSMAFTTNGNMHRHMRTHGEEPDTLKAIKDNGIVPTTNKRGGKRKESNKMGPSSSSRVSPVKKSCLEVSESNHDEKTRCPVCDKCITSKKQFETHMESHPNDSIWCRDCHRVLRDYNAMREHQNQCPKKAYGEVVDSVGFQDLNFVDFSSSKFSHIAKSFCESNVRKPSSAFHAFECGKCDKSFPCGSALRLHSVVHSEPRGTLCATCGCDFTTPTALQAHQLKHRMAEHCPPPPPLSPVEGKENGSATEPEEGRKEDFLAVLQLKNKDEPKITKIKIKRERPRESDFENMTYYVHGKPEPSHASRDPESSDFADIQSIISVTSKSPLVGGMRSSPIVAAPASPLQLTMSPESPLAADSANASPETPSKDDSEHSNTKGNDGSEDPESDGGAIVEGIYTCKLCNISFKKMSALKRHNRIHSQSCSSYSCSLCPYNSLDKSTLIRHLRTHNGERPFQCGICKYAFTTKANCERHVRKRHKKLSKSEIRCAMQYNPNMGDGSSSEVLPPEMNGSETVCKYCTVDFKSNRVLRHHLRSLHNSCRRKPFFCTLCKLGFSTKNNCIRHVAKQHPEMKEKLRDIVISNAHSDMSDQESGAISESDHNQSQSSMPETPKNFEKSSESLDFSSRRNDEEEEDAFDLSSNPAPLPLITPVVVNKLSIADDQPLNLTVRPVSYSTKANGVSNGNNLMDDMVSAANSLVSLSEILPPQEEPLDLAVHALDLSFSNPKQVMPYNFYRGEPKDANRFNSRRFPALPCCPSSPAVQMRPLHRGQPTMPVLSVPAGPPLVLAPPMPLLTLPPPPASADIPRNLSHINHNNNSNSSNDNAFRTFKIVNDRLSPRNQRSFSCMYCMAGFTLKSNMERHIKRKHPEFARPTRSRNFIPTLSPSISKNNVHTLSNKTRDALRVVLSNKASKEENSQGPIGMSPAPDDRDDDKLTNPEESQQSESSSVMETAMPLTVAESALGMEDKRNGDEEELMDCSTQDKEQENATDLASVSSVIDTANSQQIQQYLMSTENEDSKTDEDEDEEDEEDEEEDGVNFENSDAFSSPTSSGQTKKRSSYMDSPNSVACPFCSRKFPWTSSLRRHILTHTGQKPYKCPRCPIWFTTKSNCERHLVRKHGQNSDILTRSVPERPYKCNICPSSTFSTQGNLRKHYYLKHLTKTGSNGAAMKKQFRLLHPEITDDNCSQDMDDLNDEDEEQEQSDEEGAISPEKMLALGKDGNFNNLTANQNELPYKCHLCEDSFGTRSDCLSHMEASHEEEYKQLVDNGAVSNSKKLDAMETQESSNNNNNNANVNNNNVGDEQSVKELNKSPADARKVVCAFCSRRFWSAEDLRRHMRTHSGERPFECDVCRRSFSLKHSMIRHRRKHFGKANSTGQDSSDDEGPPIPKPKKQVQNSLLYLMSQSESGPKSWRSKDKGKMASEEETDLIQNLLGIRDSKMIDEMLDSADSAARLLGVKKV